MILYPLVDPPDVADGARRLRDALPDQTVARRSLTLPGVVALGPLSGRIHSSVLDGHHAG